MSKLNKVEELKTKRFVIRKSLIGKNVVITIHKCKLSYNCKLRESVVYSTTINIIQIKYILLQCKYETKWII